MRKVLTLLLGGAVWGGLIGGPAGALVGCVAGALRGDWSLGLDGAVLGGLLLAGVGAAYGAALGLLDQYRQGKNGPGPSGSRPSSGGRFAPAPPDRPEKPGGVTLLGQHSGD